MEPTSELLAPLLERWPGGIDVVPASALDRHAFTARRAVAIALDGPVDWSLLAAHYPPEVIAEARAAAAAFVVLPPQPAFADLAAVAEIARIAEHLRATDGCPWDRAQTHASLRPHLLEETYEALAALEAGDLDALRDELGDLLFQIVIHSQLASEAGRFDLGEVARRVGQKLVRRHPHVFAGTTVAADDLLLQWERIKREEKDDLGTSGPSVLDGIPPGLPALFAAERLQERAARVRLAAEPVDFPLDVDDADFLGDLLFDLVTLARERGIDAETALREANARFASRVRGVEERTRAAGRPLESYELDELRRLWEAAG